MKRCIGCGAILQSEDKSKIGYVVDMNMDYCERCFRIKHYNDLTIDVKKEVDNKEILKAIKDNDSIIVYVIDVMNIESSLDKELLKTLKGKEVILIFNKIDLLPKNHNIVKLESYIEELLKEYFKEIKLIEVIVSSKYDKNFKDFFFETIKDYKSKDFLFIGYFNAGKSSLLNALIDEDVTLTSYYPSTTIAFNKFEVDGFSFIDAPGLVFKRSLLTNLKKDEVKKYVIDKKIKAKIYQFYEKQAYIIENVLALYVTPLNNKASIIFYMSDRPNIHRTKIENAKRYMQNSKDDFSRLIGAKSKRYELNGERIELVINGLAVISFKDVKSVDIALGYDLDIIKRKSVF